MKKITTLLILVLLFSCKDDSSNHQKVDKSHEMFGIITRQLEFENVYLEQEIDSISNQSTDSLELNFTKNTREYLVFLERLKKEFSSFDNAGGDLTELGNQFEKRTLGYKNNILKITENPNLENKIDRILDIKNVTNSEAQEIKFFTFIFSNKSGPASIAYLSLKENQILQITLDYLYSKNR